jgi:hypothetical protein
VRKLILSNFLSPGDIVMLTAAVRDLHLCYPATFLTDVRTSAAALWENNPHLTALHPNEPGVENIRCEYPLIHRSNQEPWHFLHAFIAFLNEELDLRISPTAFKGMFIFHRGKNPGSRKYRKLRVKRCRSGSSPPAGSLITPSNGGTWLDIRKLLIISGENSCSYKWVNGRTITHH